MSPTALGRGEYVFDQAHLLTVAQIDPFNVEAFVPLSEFDRSAKACRPRFIRRSRLAVEYDATDDVVDRVFDAASGTMGVRLELPNPDYALPAGLNCQVRFAGMG